jgi:hypothetical protein
MSNPATSSGLKSASAAILVGPGTLKGLTVVGGSDATTVIVYDNPSAASGTVLEKIVIPAAESLRVDYSCGVVANSGLYVSIAGTGAGAVVHYCKG